MKKSFLLHFLLISKLAVTLSRFFNTALQTCLLQQCPWSSVEAPDFRISSSELYNVPSHTGMDNRLNHFQLVN